MTERNNIRTGSARPPEDHEDYKTQPCEKTDAICGSTAKVDELARRFRLGLDLFHIEDSRTLVEPSYRAIDHENSSASHFEALRKTAYTENTDRMVIGSGCSRRGRVI